VWLKHKVPSSIPMITKTFLFHVKEFSIVFSYYQNMVK
jgi:hypothetical protein